MKIAVNIIIGILLLAVALSFWYPSTREKRRGEFLDRYVMGM